MLSCQQPDDGLGAMPPRCFRIRRCDPPGPFLVTQPAPVQEDTHSVGDIRVSTEQLLTTFGRVREARKGLSYSLVTLQTQEGNDKRPAFASLTGLEVAKMGDVVHFHLGVALVYVLKMQTPAREAPRNVVREGAMSVVKAALRLANV